MQNNVNEMILSKRRGARVIANALSNMGIVSSAGATLDDWKIKRE